MTAGLFLVGFGRGKFKEAKKDDQGDHDVHFCITSGAEMVMLDGVLTIVTDALRVKRKQNPNASLAYHSLKNEPQPGTDFEFAVATWLNQVAQTNCHSDDVLFCVGVCSWHVLECICFQYVCCILTQVNDILFRPDEKQIGSEQKKVNQTMAALTVPRLSWESLKMCKITWMVKWAVNGLTPIRPVINWSSDFEIKAGEAVVLS